MQHLNILKEFFFNVTFRDKRPYFSLPQFEIKFSHILSSFKFITVAINLPYSEVNSLTRGNFYPIK